MHVFIDDSGDGGMKFAKGSSTYLVMAACIFTEAADMEAASAAILALKSKLNRGQRWEFKYTKTSDGMKDEFFAIVPQMKFTLRAIIIDKTRLTDKHLRESPGDLKAWAVMQLLTHTDGVVSDAKLVIDGQDRSAFGNKSDVYLRKTINGACPGTIKRVVFKDSVSDPLIQLADMAAGAIHREAREDGNKAVAHLKVLREKLGHQKVAFGISRNKERRPVA